MQTDSPLWEKAKGKIGLWNVDDEEAGLSRLAFLQRADRSSIPLGSGGKVLEKCLSAFMLRNG